jgi:hypothetical protein
MAGIMLQQPAPNTIRSRSYGTSDVRGLTLCSSVHTMLHKLVLFHQRLLIGKGVNEAAQSGQPRFEQMASRIRSKHAKHSTKTFQNDTQQCQNSWKTEPRYVLSLCPLQIIVTDARILPLGNGRQPRIARHYTNTLYLITLYNTPVVHCV